MSKKKKSAETVQATLEDLAAAAKSSKSKTKPSESSDKEKKESSKKSSKSSSAKKSSSKKTTSSTSKKKTTKPKETKKEEPAPEPSLYSLTDLPGVGEGTAKKLTEMGYGSVEKIARARSSTLSKKIILLF